MKLKFASQFDSKRGKGYEVEADQMERDASYNGGYRVRVVSEWKRPRWIAISWFMDA